MKLSKARRTIQLHNLADRQGGVFNPECKSLSLDVLGSRPPTRPPTRLPNGESASGVALDVKTLLDQDRLETYRNALERCLEA